MSDEKKFLATLINQQNTNIYLVSGIRLSGKIVSHDDETINFSGSDGNLLIYKNKVASIMGTVEKKKRPKGFLNMIRNRN